MARYTNKKVVTFSSGLLLQISGRDCFDLDQEAVMKWAARNHCARGAIFPKNSCIDFIERVPKVDVGDGDVHLENAIPVAAGGLQNRVHVVERLLCLFFDRAEFLLA